MDNLVEQIIELHEALESSSLPHAFGGALALAWCTERARGTIDIDVNVLVPEAEFQRVVDALPDGVKVTRQDLRILKRDGQARFWWNKTPVDLFLNSMEFHDELIHRIRWENFGGQSVPFLSCFDLAVFKSFFNRTKDWADLEEMYVAGTLDIPRVQIELSKHLGVDDERLRQLQKIGERVEDQ